MIRFLSRTCHADDDNYQIGYDNNLIVDNEQDSLNIEKDNCEAETILEEEIVRSDTDLEQRSNRQMSCEPISQSHVHSEITRKEIFENPYKEVVQANEAHENVQKNVASPKLPHIIKDNAMDIDSTFLHPSPVQSTFIDEVPFDNHTTSISQTQLEHDCMPNNHITNKFNKVLPPSDQEDHGNNGPKSEETSGNRKDDAMDIDVTQPGATLEQTLIINAVQQLPPESSRRSGSLTETVSFAKANTERSPSSDNLPKTNDNVDNNNNTLDRHTSTQPRIHHTPRPLITEIDPQQTEIKPNEFYERSLLTFISCDTDPQDMLLHNTVAHSSTRFSVSKQPQRRQHPREDGRILTDSPICPFTGLSARYQDPKTGIPYANALAFAMLRRLKMDQYRWCSTKRSMVTLRPWPRMM